jgi:D-sedoheptulose 7-phosphate isomerase
LKISKKLLSAIKSSNDAKLSLIQSEKYIFKTIDLITKNLKKKGKIFLCGNGGSAADAQHLAAEFLVRLNPKKNRIPIPALALAMDTSTITACSNDYGYENIFLRSFKAFHSKNDVLIVITTSGKSLNILKVLKFAKKKKILTVGFLGGDGGGAKKFCDISLIVKSKEISRIQEAHIFLGHFIFTQIEKNYLKKSY